MIIIAGAVLLTLGGVAFAMSRPEMADPGPAVLLDSSPKDAPAAQTTPSPSHDAAHDRDDTNEDRDAKADRDDGDEDEFHVATPRAVKADEDDWDDDDGIEVEVHDGDSDAEED
jgi:hypothetical protein